MQLTKWRQKQKGFSGVAFLIMLSVVVALTLVMLVVVPLIMETSTRMSLSEALSVLEEHGYVAYGAPTGDWTTLGDLYTQDVYPQADSTYDQGTDINRYRVGYFDSLVASNVTMPTGRGATFIVANNSTNAIGQAQADYLGDGAADDVQIQAALDALPVNGGSVLILEGTYDIEAEIVPPSGATIEGLGWGTLLVADGGVGWGGGGPIKVQNDDVVVRNLNIDGNSASWHCAYVTGAVDNATVESCFMTGSTNSDFQLGDSGTASNIRLFNCHFYGTGGDVHLEDDYYNAIVRDNTIIDRDLTLHTHAAMPASHYNAVVSGNEIIGGLIQLRGVGGVGYASHCAIVDNRIYNSPAEGILLIMVEDSVIQANTIRDPTTYGINCYGDSRRLVITDNTVTGQSDNTKEAYYIQGTNHTVTDNIAYDSAGLGFLFSQNASVIRDNQGYVHISEIRGAISNVLDVAGNVTVLCPCVEETGTTMQDYSRRDHDLTALADVSSWDTRPDFRDRVTYYDFNGTDEGLYIADHNDFSYGDGVADTPFSVVAVVDFDSAASATLIAKRNDSISREWEFSTDGSGHLRFLVTDSAAGNAVRGRKYAAAFPTAGWYVLIGTYDGSGACAGVNLYSQGVDIDDADVTAGVYTAMTNGGSEVTFGYHRNGAGAVTELFNGQGSWFAVIGQELTPDQAWSISQELLGLLGQ